MRFDTQSFTASALANSIESLRSNGILKMKAKLKASVKPIGGVVVVLALLLNSACKSSETEHKSSEIEHKVPKSEAESDRTVSPSDAAPIKVQLPLRYKVGPAAASWVDCTMAGSHDISDFHLLFRKKNSSSSSTKPKDFTLWSVVRTDSDLGDLGREIQIREAVANARVLEGAQCGKKR